MARSVRGLMAVASLARLSYALGLLIAPHRMTKLQLAAATGDNPIATMTTRAFGGAHVNLSLLSLRAALLERDVRTATALNLGFDFADLTATLLEWRDGELGDGATMASALLQSASMATWVSVLRET